MPKPGIIVKPVPVFVPRPVVVGGPTYVVSRPVVSRPGPCTCLTKEYTQASADVMLAFLAKRLGLALG